MVILLLNQFLFKFKFPVEVKIEENMFMFIKHCHQTKQIAIKPPSNARASAVAVISKFVSVSILGWH